MGLEDAVDGFPDGREGAETGEESIDGDFVGGVEDGGVGTAGCAGVAREVQGGEVGVTWRFEFEFCEGGEVEWGEAIGDAVGPGDGVLDGEAHIGGGELCEDGAVDEFDHGVDDALGVDDDVDAVHFDVEEPAGFDHFEAFVEEGGGVDGDFPAHGPSGVTEGLGWGDAGEFLGWGIAEGAAAGGEDEALDVRGGAAFEALEDRVMFGVDGKDLDAFAASGIHDDTACHDEDLFTGYGDIFSCFDGSEGGVETGGTDDGDEDEVDGGEGGEGGEGVWAIEHGGGVTGESGAGGGGGLGVDEGGDFWGPGADLLDEGVGVAEGGDGGDAHPIWEVCGDFECALADGAGAPQDGDVALAWGRVGGVHAGRIA